MTTDSDDEESVPRNINPAYVVKYKDKNYYCPPSMHDKYAARPPILEHICLAQFSIWYYSAPNRSKKTNNEERDTGTTSLQKRDHSPVD